LGGIGPQFDQWQPQALGSMPKRRWNSRCSRPGRLRPPHGLLSQQVLQALVQQALPQTLPQAGAHGGGQHFGAAQAGAGQAGA